MSGMLSFEYVFSGECSMALNKDRGGARTMNSVTKAVRARRLRVNDQAVGQRTNFPAL